jgi:hypothetical protein
MRSSVSFVNHATATGTLDEVTVTIASRTTHQTRPARQANSAPAAKGHGSEASRDDRGKLQHLRPVDDRSVDSYEEV